MNSARLVAAAWCFAVVAWLLAGVLGAPPRALAAFELRDASPMALGAVSMDLDAALEHPALALEGGGIQLGASHATLFDVQGLTAEQAWIGWIGSGAAAALFLSQAGLPGAREFRARASLEERGRRSIRLAVVVERLQFQLEGEAPTAGWTLGCGARATRSFARFDLEVSAGADRIFRSEGLDGLAVVPSVPVSFRVRSGPASAAWVDRWEGDGRRSPRLVIDLTLADALAIRFGRGGRPDRVGAALAVRWRRLEISAGRLDVASGGAVGAVALRLAPASPKARS